MQKTDNNAPKSPQISFLSRLCSEAGRYLKKKKHNVPQNFMCDHCSNKGDFQKSYPHFSSKVCDWIIPVLRSQKWACYQIYQNPHTHQKLFLNSSATICTLPTNLSPQNTANISKAHRQNMLSLSSFIKKKNLKVCRNLFFPCSIITLI